MNGVQARTTPAKTCPRENGEQGSREWHEVAPLPLASRINYGVGYDPVEGIGSRTPAVYPLMWFDMLASRIKYGAGYERDERGSPAGGGIANAR